jgi:hypothetical protein
MQVYALLGFFYVHAAYCNAHHKLQLHVLVLSSLPTSGGAGSFVSCTCNPHCLIAFASAAVHSVFCRRVCAAA